MVSWPTARHGPSRTPLYRELLTYPMTPELRRHVTTRLTQLQQIDPSISLKPLGDIRYVANKRPSSATQKPPCKKCNLTPCFATNNTDVEAWVVMMSVATG
jgi:hypothetical protein